MTTHNDPFPSDPGRRRLFQAVGAAGVVATALPFVPAEAQQRAAPAQAYVFFDPAEATFIEAAVARLIPSDETGPGALEAGVPNYIDKQLGGAWGAGERLYRSGPWQQGAATQLPASVHTGRAFPYRDSRHQPETSRVRETGAQGSGHIYRCAA